MNQITINDPDQITCDLTPAGDYILSADGFQVFEALTAPEMETAAMMRACRRAIKRSASGLTLHQLATVARKTLAAIPAA